jgi:hypothetical protein
VSNAFAGLSSSTTPAPGGCADTECPGSFDRAASELGGRVVVADNAESAPIDRELGNRAKGKFELRGFAVIRNENAELAGRRKAEPALCGGMTRGRCSDKDGQWEHEEDGAAKHASSARIGVRAREIGL